MLGQNYNCLLLDSTKLIKPVQIVLVNRTMLTSIKHGSNSMEMVKETFLKFCNQFKELSFDELHKDPKVIKFFQETIAKEDYLCNRAFQLALEVTYSKRSFDRNSVLERFDRYFDLKNTLDHFDKSSDLDQSTLFTALQSKIVKEIYPTWELTVNQTPKAFISLTNLAPKTQSLLEQNKALTGNRFPDIDIFGVPYDYKFSKDIYNIKNQIYMMPESPKAFAEFSKHILHLSRHITLNEFPTEFKSNMLIKLETISNEFACASTPAIKHEIIQTWNKFSLELAGQRPFGFGNSIFIITQKPYVADSSFLEKMDKFRIAEGHLDQTKARLALNAIIGSYPETLQDNVYNATKGALGHLFNGNNPDPDI
jgi:hypothetical protein